MISNKNIQKSIINVKLELNTTQSQLTTIKSKTINKVQCLNLSKIMSKSNELQKQYRQNCNQLFRLIVTNSLQKYNPKNYQTSTYNPSHFQIDYKSQKLPNQLYNQHSFINLSPQNINSLQKQKKLQDIYPFDNPSDLKITGQSIKHQQLIKESQKKKFHNSKNKFSVMSNIKTLQKLGNKQQSLNVKKHRTFSTQRQANKFSKQKINYDHLNTINITSNANKNLYLLNKYKNSRKLLLLPQIKQTIDKIKQFPTQQFRFQQRSNIPLFFRDSICHRNIKSQSFAVMQYPTGQLLLTNKSMNQYQIASLTKIMTFYIIQKITKKYNVSISDQKIQITDQITQATGGTSAQIRVGQIYTIQQLLYGLMLPSGNDAATALAEWGGTFLQKHQQKNIKYQNKSKFKRQYKTIQIPLTLNQKTKLFINQMNLTARQLGLKSTKYANQHGLCHSQTKSTAIDTCRLCLQCLKDNFFKQVISTQFYKCTPRHVFKQKPRRQVVWKNTNKLLRRPQFIGIKTGITVTAGPCLASAYQFRQRIYVCVVLRASKISRRFKQTRKLLAWTLQKLYKDSLNQEEQQKLHKLRKNNAELDSDHSDEEEQFNYQEKGNAEFQKRRNIINYQM